MARSEYNFVAADIAAKAGKAAAVAEITGSTDFYNRAQERQCDYCNCYLDDPFDTWADVQQRRKEGHYLMKGGQYKDPNEYRYGQTSGREHAKGLTNRRAIP